MTNKHRAAVSEAMGYDVDDIRIMQAVEEHVSSNTNSLRKTLQKKSKQFRDKGGRGVELADEIDSLRIAIAYRSVK